MAARGSNLISRMTFTGFILALVLLFFSPAASLQNSVGATKTDPGGEGENGTLQKMIVENGSVRMDLDLDRLNGISSALQKPVTLQFAVANNSFLPILVFNDLLRGPEPGSMALIPQQSIVLPSLLRASIKQLIVETLPSGERFDLAVRDASTGFTFFNIEGQQYDYGAKAQLLSITGGRLLVSKEFAKALGRSADTGLVVGTISAGAA